MARYGEIPLRLLNKLERNDSNALAVETDAIVRWLRESRLFDDQYYAIKYPDVREAGVDALEHYVLHGWREGRNPSLWFDSSFYIADNPDIAARITNPLLHYAYAGYQEGRRPNVEHKKRCKRVILVILADTLPLYDVARFVGRLPNPEPNVIIALMERPMRQDIKQQWTLERIFERGVQLRTYESGGAASALLEIMADYQDDALLLVSPLVGGLPEGIAALRSAWTRGDGCAALNYACAIFAEGELLIQRQMPAGGSGFAIPLVSYGVLILPDFIRNILANAPYYQKYAPDFPSIWLGIQRILDQSSIGGDSQATKIQPSLDNVERAEFKKQLQDVMVCFRRELSSILGINILVHLFKKEISVKYEKCLNEIMDWNNPNTLTQKLQYLKLYDDTELRTIVSDKYRSRKYIEKIVGEEYTIPILGIWKNFDEIDFSSLPNKFILKTTHGSGQNIIVQDKRQFDYADAKRKFTKWATFGPHTDGYEFNYFDVEPLIICEPLLGHNLIDYKFFCFYGEPVFMYVASDRPKTKLTFMSLSWERMDVKWGYPQHHQVPVKPNNWCKMIEISRRLSEPFSHIRIDFYELQDKSLKVGELTSYTWSGFVPIEPKSYDILLGKNLNLVAD